ncbi:hypothetical protein ACGFNU_30925 [Spirillospora sp. NPDC048911]|uniref:hypothetical protein n=1 Tax=Spirillospora sp. NPDC048911 TaxID=3364527 RepID=UPI003714845E
MNAFTFHHLSRPWLSGPAERTVVEPWLTHTAASLALNTYAEPEIPVAAPAAIAVVEPLPIYRPLAPHLVPLAA